MFGRPIALDETFSGFVNGHRIAVFWHELDLCWYAIGAHGVLVKGAEPEESLAGALDLLAAGAAEHDRSVYAA